MEEYEHVILIEDFFIWTMNPMIEYASIEIIFSRYLLKNHSNA
jgi:hypothetical protein